MDSLDLIIISGDGLAAAALILGFIAVAKGYAEGGFKIVPPSRRKAPEPALKDGERAA